jgi:hypothetical protein
VAYAISVEVKKALVAIHDASDVLPNANPSYVVGTVEAICVRAGISDVERESAVGNARTVYVVPQENRIIPIAGPAENT